MSSLGHIQVTGIRSFHPNNAQGLKFQTPVTLIVGQNGSGKTTLIECLRYACTGALPPGTVGSAKNANFVHDLNVSEMDNCKAQVKLQFFDVNNEPLVATRGMESKRKRVGKDKVWKTECRTMDSVLSKMNKRMDKKQDISSKCSDMNREMASALGVTDAVLDSVIFCHQEDSNWPLSEPKILKERFDDIFSATKYMKALEAMRNKQKEMHKDVTLYKNDMKYLTTFKEKAAECRQQIEVAERNLRQHAEDSNRLRNEIEPIKNKLDEIGRHRVETDRVRSALTSLKAEKASTEKNINELRAEIKEVYVGGIDELNREIESFDRDQKKNLAELGARKREVEQLDKKETVLDKQKGDLLTKKGKLEADIQNNKDHVENRDKQLLEYSKKVGFAGFSKTPFSDAKVVEFSDMMQEKIRQTNEDMASKKAGFDERIRDAKSEIEKALNAATGNEKAISITEGTIRSTDKGIDEVKAFLSDMDNRQARLGQLNKDIAKLENDLKVASSQVDEAKLKEEIAKLQTDRNNADAKVRSLQEELKVANRESNIRMELEMLLKEKSGKDENLQKLLNRHHLSLKEFFPGVDVGKLRDAVDDDLSKRSKQLYAANQKLNEAKSMQRSKEQEREMRIADLKTKERELQEAKEKIFKISDESDIGDELKKLRDGLESLQLEKGMVDGSESIYKSYIKKLENRPCCPLCERNFNEKKEAANLSEKLKREIKQLPDKALKLRQKIDEEQKRQTDLLQLQPVVDLVKNLTTDISSLRNRGDALAVAIRTAKKEIAELDNTVTIYTDDEQSVKTIQGDVGHIDALYQELQEIDQRVALQKEKIVSSVKIRSVDSIQEEMEGLQIDLDDLMESLASKQETLSNHRDKVQRVGQQINDLTKQKLDITNAMQQRIAYEEKYKSLKEKRDQYGQELDEMRRKTSSLQRNLEEARRKERKCETEKEDQLREFRDQLKTLENYDGKIRESNEAIKKFQASGKRDQFDDCLRKIVNVDDEIENVSRQRQTKSKQNEDQERALSQSQTKMRDLADNLKLKEKEKQIEELTTNIAKCQASFERLGGALNMGGQDYDAIVAKHLRLTKELHELEGKRNVLGQSLDEKRAELESEGIKNADTKYNDKLIELVTTEEASKDLAKYYKALDQAVIKYHSSKMEAVNDHLREMWQKIYKHNDIDYIFIQSAEAEATEKRRAYNYRVLMRSGSADLDMRGRCSAGQKVLASILIRIALAEVFSVNCGILALDEPTTNLDSANVEGLAEALVDLIQMRSEQKNFQLILITHDEGFVRMLLQGYPMEYHFRVFKNENGYSEIAEKKNSDLE